MSLADPRRLERLVLLRAADRDRAAGELERALRALQLAEREQARVAAALQAANEAENEAVSRDARGQPQTLRAGALLGAVARRDEARARRQQLARRLETAARAREAAEVDVARARAAYAEAERRLEAAESHADDARRALAQAREERGDEETLDERSARR